MSGILLSGAISWGSPGVRRVFGACGFGVDKPLEGPCNVARHGEIDVVLVIVPGEGKADLPAAAPILRTFVFCGDDGDELFDILFVCVTDAKVVDDKGEHQVAVCMFPETRGDGAWDVSKRMEELTQAIIGELASLGKTVHSLAHFSINIAIGNFAFKVVEFYNGRRDHVHGYADVFIIGEVAAVVEIF